MKIIIRDKEMDIANEVDRVFHYLSLQMKGLEQESLYISHFIIDGIEVFDGVEEYITENINDIQVIEAVLITSDELIDHMLISAEEYLTRAIPEISILADEFYRKPIEESWLKISQLAEGLNWLNQFANQIGSIELAQQFTQLIDQLTDLENAMENQDYTLIGDLLLYEISPILNDTKDKAKQLRGVGNELN